MLSCRKILRNFCVIYFSFSALAFASPYFEGNVIPANLLDKPSNEDRIEEVKQIVELQKNLTEEDAKKATAEYAITPETIILEILPELTREKYSHLYRVLDRSEETAMNTKDTIKDYFKLPRPYNFSKEVKLFTKPSYNNSYPSGHSTRGYTIAYLLGLLIPEKKSEFIKTVERVTERRILVGEHFPSDLRAGKRLAFLVIGGLFQNPEFKKDFRNAKKELAAFQPQNQIIQ